ncbi:uncharacterized protein J7T54_005540 [Emericellopsis cladophorae]|uniref:Cytochrome b561 domain-containing protein n=1 Tax=Emericellopsis cladophorae TaxID=2686198 RepID=A0A9P9Y4Z2_9HYPO|nr:uncharacterized protein J7T54_005540 [Emericellopsis cladophorae]KAI6783511.1 hypothetical protein J7T54_005540 [Emericellopsis cladophorae]
MPCRHWVLAPLVALGALFSTVFAQEPDTRPHSNHSTFVNSDGAIAFAFAIPDDNPNQFWFTLRVHRSHAWGAVGLGSEDMPGALYLMVYDNRDQSNTTFSPRVAYGYYEPEYYRDFEYELLEGTGIYDDHMVVMGKCLRNCFTWPAKGTEGGRINVNSGREKGIYGLGPLEGFTSNRLDDSLKFHVQYGSFYMDMSRAHGATRAPVLTDDSRSEGAILHQKYVRKADIMSTMHAVAMILAIVLLMPLGMVMLRLGSMVKMHAINQTIALVFVLIGFGVGIATSYRYQRSQEFTSYHQIIGFFVVFMLIGQFIMGVLNHRHYRRTHLLSIYGKIHPWLGRVVILLGIMNGFFGFTFALNRRYGIILGALIIAMCLATLITMIGRHCLEARRHRNNARLRHHPPVGSPGEQRGAWPQAPYGPPGYSNGYGFPNNGPQPAPPRGVVFPQRFDTPSQSIGLRDVASNVRRIQPPQSPSQEPGQDRPQMARRGSSQQAPEAPRELL